MLQEKSVLNSCCGSSSKQETCCDSKNKIDWLLWSGLILVISGYALSFFHIEPTLDEYTHHTRHIMDSMWWGLALGIVFVGLLSKVPKTLINAALGNGRSFNGILRATCAGLLLDLCNHGILLIAMQLYKRGASLGQTMAFLIASPWNSFSLTFILIALIDLQWTLIFILLSAIIAILSGWLFIKLVDWKILAPNPYQTTEEIQPFTQELQSALKGAKVRKTTVKDMLKIGFSESKMLLRWILIGVALAALLKTFMSTEHFQTFFGPDLMGLGLTLLAATIIEVCSEGSAPIAADILTRAKAPGNAFTFMMTGSATDYTEIMGLKETTGRWLTAFALPIVTVPQILILGYILNMASL